ncbi:hypothetical protein [Phormidesmis priestleyi]
MSTGFMQFSELVLIAFIPVRLKRSHLVF